MLTAPHPTESRGALIVAKVAGAVFVAGSALNAGLTIWRPKIYADLGLWFGGPQRLQRLWAMTIGAHPRVWVPIVGVGYELAVGGLALSEDRNRRLAGLIGIAAFHIGLLVMGLWTWAVPVLAVLGWAIARTVQRPVGKIADSGTPS